MENIYPATQQYAANTYFVVNLSVAHKLMKSYKSTATTICNLLTRVYNLL